jgi:gamma-glutamyl hydrolase
MGEFLRPKKKIFIKKCKQVEQGGARVVPLFIGKDKSYYRSMMTKINGVLLPGGTFETRKTAGFLNAAETIITIATEMNRNGEFFPVFGIGIGMEMLLYFTNKKNDIMEACDIGSSSLSLTLTKRESRATALYNSSSDHIRTLMTTHPVATFNTKRCHTRDAFKRSSLPKLWIPFSLNQEKGGKIFVSSVEHKKLPFYGVMFHPEKPAYEWVEKNNIPHTLATIEVSQYFANYFANECRKSKHWFPSKEEEDKHLIENHVVQFTGRRGSKFIQSYLFTRMDTVV